MAHGAYRPEDMRWEAVTPDYHKCFLLRVLPGNKTRTWIFVGDIRRYSLGQGTGRGTRWWRVFPAGVAEFPEVFETHFQAMDYLKQRWESRGLTPEAVRRERKERPELPVFFGEDPWGDEEEETSAAG